MTELTLEVGKYYRTATSDKALIDGTVVGSDNIYFTGSVQFMLGVQGATWNHDGKCNEYSALNLVAEWVDEPEEDEALSSLADERSDGPFVPVDLEDLDEPTDTNPNEYGINRAYKDSSESYNAIHAFLTYEVKVCLDNCNYTGAIKAAELMREIEGHTDIINGVPDCSTVRMEEM